MSDQVLHLKTHKSLTRLGIGLTLVTALIWSWFVVRWYTGNLIAEYLNAEENSVETARLAVSLDPRDPLTHWRLGEFIQKKLPPDQINEVVKEYETAARLSPNDYRFWMSYGTALEQAGEMDRAEKALARAIELAPFYSYPRWYMGNLLLRRGRNVEAFSQLRRASEGDPELRPQLFNLAWEVFSNDFNSLTSAVGNSAQTRAQFSEYLFGRERFDDGIKLWETLNDNEQRENRPTGENLINALVGAKRFHQAIPVWNDVAPATTFQATVGQFVDGGLESGLTHSPAAVFGWKVQSLQQVQIAIDGNVSHGGSRSVRIVFQVRTKLDQVALSQLVPVQPDKEYELECYFKTQKLESAGTPVLAVTDASDGSSLATSEAAPAGSNDWQRISLTFKTSPKAEAILVGVKRASCGDAPVCPIFGTIWYDDFNLKPRG
jgi:hypothetical protein